MEGDSVGCCSIEVPECAFPDATLPCSVLRGLHVRCSAIKMPNSVLGAYGDRNEAHSGDRVRLARVDSVPSLSYSMTGRLAWSRKVSFESR